MHALLGKFSQGLRWNSLEILVYQALLLTHNFFLYMVCPQELFGTIGTLFSLIYLIIALTNLGFDSTIPAFFLDATRSRQEFKKIIVLHYLPELALLLLVGTTILIVPHLIFPKMGALSNFMLLMVATLLMSEAIKKTLKSLCQLAFLNQASAYIEMATIIGYVGTVWGALYCGYPVSLPIIFLPMMVTSLLATTLYAYLTYSLYYSLPTDAPMITPSHQTMMINRLGNFSSQLIHILFSGNFLVTLFAFKFGVENVGILKLATNIIHTASSFLRTIFGFTSEAVLAHAKNFDLSEKKAVFNTINKYIYYAITLACFMCILSFKYVSSIKFSAIPAAQSCLIVFMLIQLSEHFFMAYEKFFIIEERPWYLLGVTGLSAVLCGLFLKFNFFSSLTHILSAMACIRLLTYLIIIGICSKIWHLKHPMQERSLIMGVTSLALLCFLIL